MTSKYIAISGHAWPVWPVRNFFITKIKQITVSKIKKCRVLYCERKPLSIAPLHNTKYIAQEAGNVVIDDY